MSVRSRDPHVLFDAAVGGDRASLARLLTMIERGGDDARTIGRLTYPQERRFVHRRPHRCARRRQVHADEHDDRAPARSWARGRRPGDRPLLAVLGRRDPRRPRPHAGPRHRSGRVHPLDGDPRSPRRALAGDAGGDPAARCGRPAVGARRDGRCRSGRGRDRRQGRHDGRRGEPWLGRLGAGEQGRPHGDRRHLRDQQGRPHRASTRPAATSSRCSTCPTSATTTGARRSSRRSGRPAMASTCSGRPWRTTASVITANGELERRRNFRLREELREIVARRLERRARELCTGERWDRLQQGVIERTIDPVDGRRRRCWRASAADPATVRCMADDAALVRLERRDDGVAVVTLDNPKVNALSQALLARLGDIAAELTEAPARCGRGHGRRPALRRRRRHLRVRRRGGGGSRSRLRSMPRSMPSPPSRGS